VLAVSQLLIDDALDPVGVAVAMLEALAGHAVRSGCGRLRVSSGGTDEAAVRALAEARSRLAPSTLIVEMV
jgi:hypothetical protein